MVNTRKPLYVIGLVGKAGSGKSTVAKILCEEYDFSLISLDEMGHRALEEAKDEITKHFGPEVIGPDGRIQREVLGRMVFGHMEKLLLLNALTHPRIKRLVKERLASATTHTILDGALLYEIGLAPICDFILMVDAPEEMLFDRLVRERGWSEEKAKSVLFSQRHLQFLKEQADFIIFNNDGLEKIRRQVDFFVHALV
ncbi:MAG: dephospho-CoA kinase [Brevinematales bacterium]|nr:dephospho-CoA kinase [Brevinematales bacterium]